jgi:spore coat polysaccharide biosynthesis protein SpsF
MGRSAVIGTIIQTRMGSSRLPGKILQPIAGKPLLDHILGRLTGLRHGVHIVVATSEQRRDDVVASFCAERAVDCFRGSEDDVLGRYYKCARARGFEQVVRLTADNPFTDIAELDRLIQFHLEHGYDYSCSSESLPIGVGAEIFTFAALERSFREGNAQHYREHVNEYVLEHPELFRIGRLSVPKNKHRPDVRLTVDTQEDLDRARFVAAGATGSWITTEEAIALCSRFA